MIKQTGKYQIAQAKQREKYKKSSASFTVYVQEQQKKIWIF